MRQIMRKRSQAAIEADLVEADKDRDAAVRASDLMRYQVAQRRLDDLLEELHELFLRPRPGA